jgi:hypothetical protein
MSPSPDIGRLMRMRGHPIALLAVIGLVLTACTAEAPSPSATVSPRSTPSASLPSADQPTATPEPTTSGVAWRQIDTTGKAPPAREDHTLTVSPDDATAYLFGGRTLDGQVLGDLWALDLASDAWSRVRGGPPARFGHNAAWVDGVGLVIFAGQGQTGFFNDLWAYDPAADQWTELPGHGERPISRYGSCAAVGPDGRLWISHGFTSEGTRFADTRAYDFAIGSWTDETPAAERPSERCLHGCWWTDDGRLALFAGQTTGVLALGDLWRLTPGPRPGTNAWSMVERADRWPADRQLYAFTRWGPGTIVFGGRGLDGRYLTDAWLFADRGVPTRIRAAESPAARAGAELIADPRRGRVLLFGGRDAETAFADLWELSLPSP